MKLWKKFWLLKNRYQSNLESMKGSELFFSYVHLLYYKCHEINPNHGGLNIDRFSWLDKKQKSNNYSYQ